MIYALAKISLLFSVVNYPIFGVRISEYILSFIFLLIAGARGVSIKYLVFAFVLVTYFISIAIFSPYTSELKPAQGFFFILKYLYITLLIPVAALYFFSQKNSLHDFAMIYYSSTVFLAIWALAYVAGVYYGAIYGVARPSYPFSPDYTTSDGHLYGFHLSIFLWTYVLAVKNELGHRGLVGFVTIILTISAILATGSRSAFILGILPVILMSRWSLVGIGAVIGFAILFLFPLADVVALLGSLRSLELDFSSDQSGLGRLRKLSVGLSELGLFGLGVSPFRSELIWYDGIVAILMSHGGVILLLAFFVFTICILLTGLRSRRYKFCAVFVIFCAFQLVTEFIFVFRASYITVFALFYLYLRERRYGPSNEYLGKNRKELVDSERM